jgi:hypothetical protein
MNETLQAQVYYRGTKVGMPHKSVATLDKDKLEIVSKKSNQSRKTKLADVSRAKLSNTVVGLHFKDGSYWSLDFQTFSRRIIFALLGRFGILVGSFSGPGREQAQAWMAELAKRGVSDS